MTCVGVTKVVLIDKVVLGGPKKGDEKEQYFWVHNFMGTNLWGQKMSKKGGKIQKSNF